MVNSVFQATALSPLRDSLNAEPGGASLAISRQRMSGNPKSSFRVKKEEELIKTVTFECAICGAAITQALLPLGLGRSLCLDRWRRCSAPGLFWNNCPGVLWCRGW